MKWYLKNAMAALVVLCCAVRAQATPVNPGTGAPLGTSHGSASDPSGLGVQFSGFSNDFNNNNWSLGWSFQVGSSNINVTALGMFDDSLGGGPGWSTSHQVGMYDSSGNLLASTTVTSADAAQNFFRFASISSLTLLAGQTYTITGTTGSDNYTWATNGPTFLSGITFLSDEFVLSSTLAYPTQSSLGGTDGWFGANFLGSVSATPEPTSLTLLGLCSLGVAGYRLRRRKQVVTA